MTERLEVRLRQRWTGMALDIDFAARWPGTTVLFGPSGAGKSSIVAAVAGLLRPDYARIVVPGRVLTDTERRVFVAPERRRVGLVYQDSLLFPHMSVRDNLRFGLRRAPADEGGMSVPEAVSLLGLEALLDRRPRTLSGGERQRVAIGRALLSRPRLLAMDEPLAGLDAARRSDILACLLRLRSDVATPILYVTHDRAEAERLADTLVRVEAGRVVRVEERA